MSVFNTDNGRYYGDGKKIPSTIVLKPPYTNAMLLVWMNIHISDDDQLELGCELRNSPKAMNMNPPKILKPANMYPSVLQILNIFYSPPTVYKKHRQE